MTFDEIQQALMRLTAERERTVTALQPLTRPFAPLTDTRRSLSPEELEQARRDLEDAVPGFSVWFEPRHVRYVLIPQRPGRVLP